MSVPVSSGLRRFNGLADDTLIDELMACCAVPEWARQVAASRPFAGVDALLHTADVVLAALHWSQVSRALLAHPRIGERAIGSGRDANWSRDEQDAAASDDQRIQQGLVAGNVAYEKRFGHVFLICATGLSAVRLLDALTERLSNDDATERSVVYEELRKIVALRIKKLVTE